MNVRAAARLLGILIALGMAACAVRHEPVAEGGHSASPPERTEAAVAQPHVSRQVIGIATGSPRETNYRIGEELAKYVAPEADVDLDVLATRGSADNLHLLTSDPSVDLALVQYDVLQAVTDEARRGDAAAARLADPLRIVTPLFAEEIHFVVRRDAKLMSVDDIKGKRINLGVAGSGSALTAAALYRRMFHEPIRARDARYLPDDLALSALTVDKSVDVVVVVAAQPARLFSQMKAEARNYIRLLPIDRGSAATRDALKVYLPATIRTRSYASWLDHDVPALSVVSFLVTTDRSTNALAPRLSAFARSLCDNLEELRADGHPKWREVRLGQQLGVGWKYAEAAQKEFGPCVGK